MSLNQIVKYPSEQSAFDTSGSKNNVDFVLPGGQVYDLSRSYIAITVDSRSATTAGLEFIAKNYLSLGTSVDGTASNSNNAIFLPSQASIIKNAHISSQNAGKISDIRRVDKYAFTKALYSKSTEDQRNDLGTMNSHIVEQSTQSGNSVEFNTYGNELSRYRTHDIRIPLKEIMPYCRTSAHDGNRHGDTRLHTEINFDKFTRVEVSLSGVIEAPQTASAATADNEGTTKIDEMENITVALGNPATQLTLVTKAKYASKNGMPFFVGEVVVVAGTYTPDGGAEALPAQQKTIVEIVQNADDSVSLVLDSAITTTTALATGKVISALEVSDLANDTATETLTINNVELVTEIVQDAPKSGPITYDTVLSEEDTYTAGNSLNRVYDVPPMTKNVYIMFFKNNGVVSADQHLNTYRVTLDNVEQSQGPVTMSGPEHYDNIIRTFSNGGGELNNLSERYFKSFGRGNLKQGIVSNMIAYPVPFLNRSQKLQIELTADTGQNLQGRLIVYYDVVKQA